MKKILENLWKHENFWKNLWKHANFWKIPGNIKISGKFLETPDSVMKDVRVGAGLQVSVGFSLESSKLRVQKGRKSQFEVSKILVQLKSNINFSLK